MRGLGVIARADQGGLSAQTYEIWRHLQPERVLIVDLGLAARGGQTHPERYDAPWCTTFVTQHRRGGVEIEQFIAGLDVLYTAETAYEDHVWRYARAHRCATVLHVNPELWWAPDRQATALWAASEWELDRLPPRVEHVPLPIALDQFTYRRRRKLDTMFVTTGEAMLDRNGWEIVQAALTHVERPLRLLWRGGPDSTDPTPRQVGKVTVEWLPAVDHYENVIPEEADLLVMPRRYGGQCLPVNEAAACGIPSLMTDLSPQRFWFPSHCLVPAFEQQKAQMKGGIFSVFDADPKVVADHINRFADNDQLMADTSLHARAWAETRGWDVQLADWQTRFEQLSTQR